MKLSTKKGWIELHADEKRVLAKAEALAVAIKKHGERDLIEAADAVLIGLSKLSVALSDRDIPE